MNIFKFKHYNFKFILNSSMTNRPSMTEAKIGLIFNFIVYQEVLDSCICKIIC